MKLAKVFFLLLLIHSGLQAQSVEDVLKGSVKNPPIFHFNLMLNRSTYIADLSEIVYSQLSSRIKEDPNFNKEAWKTVQYPKIEINDYSFAGGGKGYRFTFDTKEVYDQFTDYTETENQLREINRYKEILLAGASSTRATALFNARAEQAIGYYNSGNFRLAIMALDHMIADYANQYSQLDDIYFIRGESHFALKHYHEARKDYQLILTKYAGASSFTNNAIYRTLFINYVYSQNETLLEDWEKLKGQVNSQNQTYYDIQMLLAIIHHQRGDFQKTIDILQAVPREYAGYMMANYTIGNAYVNLDDIENAIRYYGRVERTTLWPWDSKALKKLKTSALLQLGYLNYLKGVEMIRSGEFRTEEIVDGRKVTITPQTYFTTGKGYFDQVEKNHPEYSSAALAETWIDLQQANYNTALLKVQNYISTVSNQELLYQAVFLEGYIKQRKNPSNIEKSENSYNYVINGMITHQFLTDFFNNRNIINRQRVNMEVYVESRNLPQNSLAVANESIETLGSVSRKLGVSDKIQFRKDNRLMDDRILEELSDDISTLDKQKGNLRQRGLRDMVSFIDSAITSLKGIVDRAYAEPIGKDIVLFAQHAPILIRSSETAGQNSQRMLRDVASIEVNRAVDLENRLSGAVSANRDPSKRDVLSYMEIVVDDVKNRFNSIEVSFYEADFYRPQTEIERWGDASAFGLTALLYSEFDRRQRENEENLKIKSALRRALSEKKDQFERYIKDLERIESQRQFVQRIDSVRSDFEVKLTDYRSVFFDPISLQPVPAEQLARLKEDKDAKKEETKAPDEKKPEQKKSSGKRGK